MKGFPIEFSKAQSQKVPYISSEKDIMTVTEEGGFIRQREPLSKERATGLTSIFLETLTVIPVG